MSTVEDMAEGSFQDVIDDPKAKPKEVKTLVFCTGKFYYDLLEVKENKDRGDVALVRIEQLFPMPAEKMKAVMKKYRNAKDIVWAQEEPRNMGVWSHMMMHFPESRNFRVASRRFYASPAAGSAVRSKLRHQQVIDFVFDKTKDNQSRHQSKKSDAL